MSNKGGKSGKIIKKDLANTLERVCVRLGEIEEVLVSLMKATDRNTKFRVEDQEKRGEKRIILP